MNRAGLLNFWYYDEETFDFANGKLLLRGSNGSGKSVTMQSFLPVLLDGRTSPDRLDPFGSKARRMEDYLLGEKDIVNRDERTGYLFIECKREETDQYVTIGIGLQAKRHKQMKFWGFVITDNRRIGIDVSLYKEETNAGEIQKIPLSRIEWENVLGAGGQVVQTKGEYMRLVNKYLFGYESIEAYEDLIKLLIQLRSPKLSKDFRPTVIYEILEAALPPLTDEDLRHLSDTIEQMDQTKQQIEQLMREATALQSLNQTYTTYNKAVLTSQANGFIEATNRLEREKALHEKQVKQGEQIQEEIQALQQSIRTLSIKQSTYKKQEERLRGHEIWNLEKEYQEQKDRLQEETTKYNRKQEQLDTKNQNFLQLRENQRKMEEQIEHYEEELEDHLVNLANDADEASFADRHELNTQDFERHRTEAFDFSLWMKDTSAYVEHIETIIEELRKYESLKNRYQEKDKELANESKKLDEASYQEQEWSRLFEEDKESKLNEMYTWLKTADWLTIDQATLQEVARQLHQLYEPTAYEQVKEPFRKATHNYIDEERKQLLKLNAEREQLESDKELKNKELMEWKIKKDPEPTIDPLTIQARETLKQNNISFVPFYAAVEFQEHVSEEVRQRIEATLMDAGIINALITNKEIDITHDRILTANPNMMTHTLADYLKPDVDANTSILASRVEKLLQSMVIEDEVTSAFAINEAGYYQIGLLKGHALPVESVRFIGREARKRFREGQIRLLEAEIVEIDESILSIDEEIETHKQLIQRAEQQMEQFPNDLDLAESFQQVRTIRFEINHYKQRIQALSEELQQLSKEYKQLKYTLDEQTRHDHMELTLESYVVVQQVMKRYEKDVSSLEKSHIQYVNVENRVQELTNRIADAEEEIMEIQGELNSVESQMQKLRQDMDQIKQQLEQAGMQNIRQQIAEVQQELTSLEKELRGKEIQKPVRESELQRLEEDITSQQQLAEFWRQLKEAWASSFKRELGYRFVEVGKEENLESIAKHIMKDIGQILKEKEHSKLSGQLSSSFYKQQTDLMEYRMSIFTAPYDIPAWMEEVDEDLIPHIEQWKQKSNRTLIELNYQGKQVSPYTVQQDTELEQERQQSFLDEQDRALYEEILFHSVGQKLRARIRRAEKWVEQMRKVMETRDTSSGLTFSIRWKPKTADSEDEMDTIDLVHLLRQDPKLLKDEDLEKITTHFRSKITQAKELIDGNNEMQTLLQVLKEVLDYRKWFSFILYFQREGEVRRELTNNQFYKFSGGEKAMAMYIPLFTACYSRYSEAAPEAPYIISLDEAFAGVDENNIREMFEVVEQLGFDYMMNSQVLWGDYDTISELAISELIRPKNADYVSVLRYHWDGKKRELAK